jgi:transposase
MLSEAAQSIAARDYSAFRAHAGVAPVTKRSGKRLSVIMRQACNDRLRNALYHWARVSMQKDPVTKLKYASLRARGHSHGRALRGVADGLLRLLFGMLKGGSLFDMERRSVA